MAYLHVTLIFRFQINQYISLYTRTGVLPSKVFQGQAAEVCHLLWHSWTNCQFTINSFPLDGICFKLYNYNDFLGNAIPGKIQKLVWYIFNIYRNIF